MGAHRQFILCGGGILNLIELCCYRLAERGIISEEAARILVTLHRRGPLNGVELAEWSEIEIDEATLEANRLVEMRAVEQKGYRYLMNNAILSLMTLINREGRQEEICSKDTRTVLQQLKVKNELAYAEQIA